MTDSTTTKLRGHDQWDDHCPYRSFVASSPRHTARDQTAATRPRTQLKPHLDLETAVRLALPVGRRRQAAAQVAEAMSVWIALMLGGIPGRPGVEQAMKL